ncbi:2-polyprenyl-6-methoxyphenol hydroxylase-like FAD-dependent oxidoreductase [Actinoplanes octamycinicus]|uniref:2-polyprenyl-6-methoxyphenol hydroxylase-like FAD-dependent oxidoreductase n=1 Tax=Actinoplanes octamycinicus TaxID=135948 RepID=A0A7W7GQR1_9ACTN|nr:FAD-dependent monooxygenase [Actinoplanes octamycinicus]MBB4736559.1 2-polyprenyl-6-methoxyphenol hydroxylase-like FAD-dependent oxidoreductase [Actinoplanes octamycinicus]GIE62924.1 FAD-dependent oxidoreductase [Actinoplanes octamycinicus]
MRVLISGSSIAGPASAFWLHRAGAEVTVVEKSRAPRPGGHAVDIRGVARQVVEWMGVREAIRDRQVDERGWMLVNARNRPMGRMPADAFGGEGIVAEIEIARGDLAEVLRDATAGFTDYRYGDRITALDQDPAGVDVTFASGLRERYDLVIGADGVHSGVRSLAFGPESDHLKYLGLYSAYFTVTDPGDLDNWYLMYNEPGVVAGLRPERGGTAKAHLGFREPQARYERLSPDEERRVVAERLAGAGWKVPELLRQMPDAPDFFFDSINQVHVKRWWRGRVALVGDAGYCGSPLAGLGTSMSLVGAYVLAGELATGTDPERAFAAYQETMADYVAAGLELPPGGAAGLAPHSRLMIRARATSMSMMTRWPMRQLLAKQFGKAEAITLRDYGLLTPAGQSR